MAIKFEQARQARILNLLIQSSQPLTSQYFASYFNISQRLIRYDIQHLKRKISPYQCEITSIRGTGYMISGEIENLQKEMKTELGELYYYDNIDTKDKFIREQLILRYLLLNNRTVTTKELIEQFYITRATLKEDINRAVETIEPYHMTIHHTPYKGVFLQGTETNKRMLLARETAFYKESPLLGFIQKELDFVSFKIEEIIIFVKEYFHIILSTVESYNLYVHIWIMIYRIWQNYTIEEETLYIEYINKEQLELARDFLRKHIYWVDISDKEAYYFTLLILSSGASNQKLYNEANTMITSLSKETDIIFDSQLIDDVSHLLIPIIIKSKNQISSNSIMIREIKKIKPLCIDLSYQLVKKIETKYNISVFDNDICSLAYLFLNHTILPKEIKTKKIVITTSIGYLLSKHLIYRLKQEFQDIQFEYLELYEINNYDFTECILIISDTFIESSHLNVRSIKINLMYTQKDIERIARYIHRSYQTTSKNITASLTTISITSVEGILDIISTYANIDINTLLQRETKITFETNKSCAIICDYNNKIESKGWYSREGIYWKNATIHYFFYINVLHVKPFNYYNIENYITQIKETENNPLNQ
ncbi:MAG: BglG family transcription antiterminator [Coprobacillaceae bacterium]